MVFMWLCFVHSYNPVVEYLQLDLCSLPQPLPSFFLIFPFISLLHHLIDFISLRSSGSNYFPVSYNTPVSDFIYYIIKNFMKNFWTYLSFLVTGLPSPQGSVHGQPQVGTLSTPGPPGVIMGSHVGGVGGVRRNRAGWREWRRADPTLINSLWKSKMGHGIRSQLGKLKSLLDISFRRNKNSFGRVY